MSWTDERVNLLTKLWGDGHTAAEIAQQLGGVTRNAVIGKAHRLKLSGRVSPIQKNAKKIASAANHNAKPAPVTPKIVASQPAQIISPKERAVNTNASISKVTKAAPLKAAILAGEDIDPNRKRYALTDLNARQCRWPFGDPRDKKFGFCGCEISSASPYCEEHTAMAYQSSSKARVLKAEDFEKAEERAAQKMANQ